MVLDDDEVVACCAELRGAEWSDPMASSRERGIARAVIWRGSRFQRCSDEATRLPRAGVPRIDPAGFRMPLDERVSAIQTRVRVCLDHTVTSKKRLRKDRGSASVLKREGMPPDRSHHDVGASEDMKTRVNGVRAQRRPRCPRSKASVVHAFA